MKKEEVEKFKDYPSGSGGRMMYDLVNLTFQEYLLKYYSHPELKRWKYINGLFINPLFNETVWSEYLDVLNKAKIDFLPDKNKLDKFYVLIESDPRFDIDLKRFFAFLYSIDFFGKLSFEEWLKVNNWSHPWYVSDDDSSGKSILEILKNINGQNYLKQTLSELSIFR